VIERSEKDLMKKLVFFLLLNSVAFVSVFSQETIYVSANGSDEQGWSETKPTNLNRALAQVSLGTAKKIIIIGTLDKNSTNHDGSKLPFIFVLYDMLNHEKSNLKEIIISGKPNAQGAERAVLSARNSGMGVIGILGLKIRFENIEITNGEGDDGYGGIHIIANAQVTLGAGAIVSGNSRYAITVLEGSTCIIDGGEVKNNRGCIGVLGQLILRNGTIRDNSLSDSGGGVFIGDGGQFTMSGGTITGNRTDTTGNYSGGGVCVYQGGRFTMTGGSITNNRAQFAGGGVAVISGGIFSQTGGTISGNTAPRSADIFRE
jgi:hypothetical protein